MVGWPQSVGAQPADAWNQGQLAHLIPTASHERLLIKASFKAPLTDAPRLSVNGKSIEGVQTDPQGRFWRFDALSLQPATPYELRLTEPGGAPLCDPWPLTTFPAPDAAPDRLRILAFTCAGGYDGPRLEGKTTYLDMAARRRLLARGMSFRPDVVIANGDHIYWDIKTSLNKPFAKYVQEQVGAKFGGALDLTVPMLHPRNASIFLGVCDYQILGLYGTTLRSTPAYFVTHDHDMFENDEFDAHVAALPPDTYGTLGAEQTQRLYYPEFLPAPHRPAWLPGGDKAGAPTGTNITFGTLRWGKLLEAVFYDCQRYVDYKEDHAKVLPQWVEDWVIARTRTEDTAHFFHAPSLPFAYSSGKLGDWYPDLLDDETGRLVLYRKKAGWQRGWFAQHQRLIEALAAQTRRAPVIVQGDFHATAAGTMVRSASSRWRARTRRNDRHAGDGGHGLPVGLPQCRIEALATGGHGRSAQADGEEWLRHHRCDTRQADVHAVHVPPTAARRGNRHDEARARLRSATQSMRLGGNMGDFLPLVPAAHAGDDAGQPSSDR